MDEQQERKMRRRAIRWALQGVKGSEIVRRSRRSRSWLKKWKQRFDRSGWAGLHSASRAPRHPRRRWVARIRRAVVAARRRLERRDFGLIGARAIQAELEAGGWKRSAIPPVSTIKRWLQAAGVTGQAAPLPAYFPQPTPRAGYPIQQMDWTARYLPGGAKVFAFHSLDLSSRAMYQTLARDKSWATARAHLLKSWEILGLPAALQMDNDATFCGGYKVKRVLGACVRLCLAVGIEPIFIPFGEPKRNGPVERLHGLWGQVVWARRRFRQVTPVLRTSPRFAAWYALHVAPLPTGSAVCHLTTEQAAVLPEPLPLYAGRIHFLRRVNPDGTIRILNEHWRVSRRLAGQYVWATVVTHEHCLRIYHKHAANSPVHLVKAYPYALPEPVRPLPACFRRTTRRRRMDTML